MQKFYVMAPSRDDYGKLYYSRLHMRALTLSTAKRDADRCGGYVCPLGKTDPVYVAR